MTFSNGRRLLVLIKAHPGKITGVVIGVEGAKLCIGNFCRA
jgi:hypothetical protein